MSPTLRRLGLVASATAAALALSACGSNIADDEGDAAAASEEGPVVIGALVDQTAYLKTLDEGVLQGIQSAVEAVNADGGVLGGRELEVVVEDNAADPQQQVQAFQRVMSEDPVLFLNGFSSAGNAATAPLAGQEEVPMIVASVTPPDDEEWVFSTIVPAKYETGTRVEYLVEQGITKVGILHDPTPFGKLQLDALTGQLEEAGIEIVGVQEHATDAVDLRPQVSNLLGASTAAVVKVSAGPTQIVAAKALADAGSSVPLLIGVDSHANITQATAAYPELLVTAAPLQVESELGDDQRTEGITRFVEANPGVDDPTYIGRGWDAVFLAVQAIEEAGSTDGAALRDAIVSMGEYEGTSAAYDYTDEDHYGITTNPNYIARITADSTEIVFTPAK